MGGIIGKILLFLTFPGAIINSIIKQLFCRIFRVAVFDIAYFDLGNFSGYIEHEIPKKFSTQLAMVVMPFITGTLLGIAIAFPGTISIEDRGILHLMYFTSVWIGLSVVIHAVPKVTYAQKMLKTLWKNESSFLLKLSCSPFLALIYIANAMTYFELLSIIYGLAVVYLPSLIVNRI